MDIFTTQLTRVVSTPIKATKLKVKSLSKDASSAALDENLDHFKHQGNPILTEVYGRDGEKHGSAAHEEVENKAEDSEDDEPDQHLDVYV